MRDFIYDVLTAAFGAVVTCVLYYFMVGPLFVYFGWRPCYGC